MAEKFKSDIPESEVTPREFFFNRRNFLSALGLGVFAVPWACPSANGGEEETER